MKVESQRAYIEISKIDNSLKHICIHLPSCGSGYTKKGTYKECFEDAFGHLEKLCDKKREFEYLNELKNEYKKL